MKITKRQLRRIIKEEKARLNEINYEVTGGHNLADDAAYGDTVTDMADALEEVIQRFLNLGLTEADMDEAWHAAKSDWV